MTYERMKELCFTVSGTGPIRPNVFLDDNYDI